MIQDQTRRKEAYIVMDAGGRIEEANAEAARLRRARDDLERIPPKEFHIRNPGDRVEPGMVVEDSDVLGGDERELHVSDVGRIADTGVNRGP